MTDPKSSDAQIRRRWINLGEFVAVAGLVISGLALWNSWGGEQRAETKPERPTVVEAKPRAIPLALRGRVQSDGKALVLSPVENSHSLDSVTLTASGRRVEVASDGVVTAGAIQSIVGDRKKDEKTGSIPVSVEARYVEAGEDRLGRGAYRIRYRWDGGGLFGGHQLRLVGWSRG